MSSSSETGAPPPALSIVIPTRNRAEGVLRAVQSVLQCPRPDIEAVIVDDGSDDDTAARLAQIPDARLRYHFLDSTGNANRARNTGAGLVRSPLIAFLDSDDAFGPGRIDRLIAFFAHRPDADCLIDGYVEFSRGRQSVHRLPPTDPDRATLRYMLLAHIIPLTNSAITIRRAAFESISGYDESMRRHQDRELLLRLVQQHSICLGDGIDVEKHRSANSISHEYDGYIDGLDALASRVPDFFDPQNQRLFSYLIVRGILKALITGHWPAAIREIRRLRDADKLPRGFVRNLVGYRIGRQKRRRYFSPG